MNAASAASAPPPEEIALIARRLVRRAGAATLATASAADGWPFASLVATACTQDGDPLLLLSDLAEHSRNLAADPRASLLFVAAPADETLAEARVTVVGRLVPQSSPETSPEAVSAARARYLARQPGAAGYAGFKDFRLYRMSVERAHLVAGFGRIGWLTRDELLGAPAPGLAESAAGIVEHMNADHADAVALYATRLLGLAPGPWRMTGIDPDGTDLAAEIEGRTATARLDFAARVEDATAARTELVRLVGEARRTV